MKLKHFIVIALTFLALVACSANEDNAFEENEEKNIKELVNDYSLRNIKDQSASITSHELIATDRNGNKASYDLPKEEFFVSIAPYIEQIHPWQIHNLTGCQGELVNKEFDVYIEDIEGNVLVDEKLKSQSNGFIDIWLPRDKEYRIEIKYDDKKVESEFSTFENDNTCITTMQLM